MPFTLRDYISRATAGIGAAGANQAFIEMIRAVGMKYLCRDAGERIFGGVAIPVADKRFVQV